MSTVDCFVIRHAESLPDRNVPEDEWPLSVTGREQARALCVKMFDLGVKRIYSSPYSRAVATVRPLAEALGIDIEIRNDLRERRLAMGEIHNWREELEKRGWTSILVFLQVNPAVPCLSATGASVRAGYLAHHRHFTHCNLLAR
jgi:broad specificity phosphatase PhoE